MSEFTHKNSVQCLNSTLDIFDVPPTQTSVDQGYWVEVRPTSAITQLSMLDFDISGSGPEYFDLANTFLKVTASVVNANGNNLANDVEVAPVNNWLHALCSKIDLTLNGTSVSFSSHHYGYRAYMEAFANFGSDTK